MVAQMTRKPSSLRSVQQAGILPTVDSFPPVNIRRGHHTCTQRPSPSLVVKFPRDGKLRRAVFGPDQKHPAKMHLGLALELARLYARPGDTILDPFGGMGTTGVAALAHGCDAILTEIEPEWAESSKAVVHRAMLEQTLEVFEYEHRTPVSQLRWNNNPGLKRHDHEQRMIARAVVHLMDARGIDLEVVPVGANAIITSPPYLARESSPHFFGLKLAQVYRAAASVLVPGGAFVVVCKDPIRQNRRQRFALQNILILEALGLEMRDWWRRECTPSLYANVQRKQFPDAPRVDHEDVLVFQKPRGVVLGVEYPSVVLGVEYPSVVPGEQP
jgi:16S rRNA G966 N2-methylase RsmD